MITSFSYTNAKGETATRICNVVHESETEIRGFDYNKLDQSEQETVNKVYGSKYKPTPVPTVKAYRIFKKSNMK